jgi:hypothetical protein
LRQKHKIGFGLLTLASHIPVMNGFRVLSIFSEFQIPLMFGTTDVSGSLHFYLSTVGPILLICNGLLGFMNVFLMYKRRLRVFWWAHSLGGLTVGGLDAWGAMIFFRSYHLQSVFTLLPVFVTLVTLIGVYLVYGHVDRKIEA